MNDKIILLLQNWGVTEGFLPFIYWTIVLLTVAFVVYASNAVCEKVVVPLVKSLTRKTQTAWDDALLNNKVLNDLCAIVPPVLLTILLPLFFDGNSRLSLLTLKFCNVYVVIVAVR